MIVAAPRFFRKRTTTIASLFRGNLRVLRLHGPKTSTRRVKGFLRRLPVRCVPHVIARRRFRLTSIFNLGKVRLGKHGPRVPSKCGKRIDHSYRSLRRILGRGSSYGCIFLDPVCSDVSGRNCSSTCSYSALRGTRRTNVVSSGIVTLNNVALRRLPRVTTLNFKNTMLLKSI